MSFHDPTVSTTFVFSIITFVIMARNCQTLAHIQIELKQKTHPMTRLPGIEKNQNFTFTWDVLRRLPSTISISHIKFEFKKFSDR